MRAPLVLMLLALLGACASAPPIPDARESGTAEPVVHVEEDFESEDFRQRFVMHGKNDKIEIVPSPTPDRPGNVLKVRIPKRSHTGANFSWLFRDHPGGEPERLYARYFMRFEPGWNSGEGGKLPGPSGTYDRAGWGGRQNDGTNGWSTRMGFRNSWKSGATQLTYYAYHVNTETQWGDSVVWDRTRSFIGIDPVGSLEHGRWYCVESYIQLNDPERMNGRLTGWIDEELAADRKGLVFRTTPALKVEKFWFNVYYGGTGTPAEELVVYFDDLVLSDTRLGCDAP